jgi:hypothetical protein
MTSASGGSKLICTCVEKWKIKREKETRNGSVFGKLRKVIPRVDLTLGFLSLFFFFTFFIVVLGGGTLQRF